MSDTIKVKLVRSIIGRKSEQKDWIRLMGFTKLNQVREYPDNPATRGQIAKVAHLVKIVD
ncbi:MAG: 50S ribosomal protein L30 [Magnetococcus sp. WYHC-3]